MKLEKQVGLVVVGCPIRDREVVLPGYLQALYDLDYDKKEIVLLFLVNDSVDDTMEILQKFCFDHISEYKDILIFEEIYDFMKDIRSKGRNTLTFERFAIFRNAWLGKIKKINYKINWVFSIDSDIIVPSNTLKKLINNDKDICSVLVSNMDVSLGHGKDYMNILKRSSNLRTEYEHILKYPIDSVFEVDVTGACYLIKRKVLDNTKYEGHIQGEDCSFCSAAKANGYSIWCDSTIQVDHRMKWS